MDVLLVVALLLSCSLVSAQDCPLPTQSEIENLLRPLLANADGGSPSNYNPSIIGSVHYVCQAQGILRDTYQYVSIIANYTPNTGQPQRNSIFELGCVNGSAWDTDSTLATPAGGLVNAPTRTDCIQCRSVFGNDRCRTCDSICSNTCLGRCVSSPTICCAVFTANGTCSTDTNCTSSGVNYIATESTGCSCTCNLTCTAGYSPNSNCTDCQFIDICERDMPCQNGGDCILLSAPDNYTCNCTTGYGGVDCSNIIPITLPVSPSVILSPSGPVIVLEGNDLFVNCTSTEAAVYTWWANDNGAVVTTNSSATHPLYITNMTQSQSGVYTCAVILDNGRAISSSIAVTVEGGWSTAASTHIVGLLPVGRTDVLNLLITTVENQTVNFTVKSVNETIATGSVTAGTPTTISSNRLLSYIVGTRSERMKGIVVTTETQSKISVTVVLHSGSEFSSGGYQNYPVWGYPVSSYVYYAVSTGATDASHFSSVLIVSANDATNITITPKVAIRIPSDLSPTGNQFVVSPNNSTTIQLNYLETLLIIPEISRTDLTGLRVESNKPIGIYSGHTCGDVPVGISTCDFIGEQLLPVASWGNAFLVSSFANRPSGYILKIIASQENTAVDIACNNSAYSLMIPDKGGNLSQGISQESCYVISSKPIQVAQLSLGQLNTIDNTGLQQFGDPALVIIPPTHHYINNATIPVLGLDQSISTYVNLAVISSCNASGIQINGASLQSQPWITVNNSNNLGYILSGYRVTTGQSSVWSGNPNDRVFPMVYGQAIFTGYAYTGSLNMIPYQNEGELPQMCFTEVVYSTTLLLPVTITPTVTSLIFTLSLEDTFTSPIPEMSSSLEPFMTPSPSPPVNVAPSVTVLNSSIAVLAGSNVTMVCDVQQGYPQPTIQWRFADTFLSNSSNYSITGSRVLTVYNVTRNNAGLYYCIATNIAGLSSASILLSVQEPPSFYGSLLRDISVPLNGGITLNCSVSGVPRPTVDWFFSDRYDDFLLLIHEGVTVVNVSEYQVISSLTLRNLRLSGGGFYRCYASNNLVEYRRIRASAFVTLLLPPRVIPDGGILNSFSVQSGTFTTNCTFAGIPRPTVTWYHNGQVLSNITGKVTISHMQFEDDIIVSNLTIVNLQKSTDEGNYTCKGINGVPNLVNALDNSQTILQIEVIPIVVPVRNRVGAVVNTTANISFSITNTADLIRNTSVQWEFQQLGSNTFSAINSPLLSNGNLSLILPAVQLSNRGTYRVFVSNEAGIGNSTSVLDVFVGAVLLNYNGSAKMNLTGQSVSFNCTADGIPRPNIVWRKDGQLIINSTKRNIQSSGSSGFRSAIIPGILQTTSTLTIRDLTGRDNGSYSCRADNEANIGAILRVPYTLQVTEPPPPNYCESSPCGANGRCRSLADTYLCECFEDYAGRDCENKVVVAIPPEITRPPQATTGRLYSSVNLTCRATGSPTPSILWYKDNQLILNDNSDPDIFVFSELDLSDRGFYHCEARNIIDGRNVSVNSSAVLLNITNVVQYEAEMKLPVDFYNTTNQSTAAERIRQLIQESNNYLAGSNISNTSFFFLDLLDSAEIDPRSTTLPVVVTLVAEEGQGDEQLVTGVQNQLNLLSQQLTVSISVTEVNRFDGCLSSSTVIPSPSGNDELNLTVIWPETNIGVLSVVNCPCGNDTSTDSGQLQATRYCGGDFTSGAQWDVANVSRCNFSDLARRICRLKDLPVMERVEQLETLTSNTTTLGSNEVTASVSVLVTATEDVSGNITLTMTFLDVVDNILVVNEEVLQESQQTSNTSAKVLEAIETVVEDIPITNASEPVVIAQTSFAVSVQQVDFEEFMERGQTFSVNIDSFSTGNLSSNDLSFQSARTSPPTGSISLPSNLFNALAGITNNTRITHAVFISDSLFLRRSDDFLDVASIIISASVVGVGTIRGINPPVGLDFQINPNVNGSSPQCTFWNQTLDEGYGDWSSEGCNTNVISNGTQVNCQCDHLTSFAILLDVSVTIEPTERTTITLFLDSVTYIGLIVSLICLTITVVSYLSSKKLRTSDHGQLLLNLCFALMGLYLSFIISLHSKHVDGLCVFIATVLQYFFLVTFAVMAAEAINLYMNLVVVLGRKIHRFVLKATILAWVVPFFIALFCVAPNYKNYKSDPPNFCRAFNAPFYIGMVVPFLIIYIFNWVVFVIIITSLIRKTMSSKLKEAKSKKDNKSSSFFKQQLIIAVTLSVLFGLGWGIGLLATEDIYNDKTVRDLFASLFVLTTAFHGFFIFVMHCLRSKDARNVWKKWFFGVTGKDFGEFTSSTFNRIGRYNRPGSSNTTGIKSPTRKSDQTYSQAEKGSTFVYEDEMKGFSGQLEDSDGQGTLRFHTKKADESELGPIVDPEIEETKFAGDVITKAENPIFDVTVQESKEKSDAASSKETEEPMEAAEVVVKESETAKSEGTSKDDEITVEEPVIAPKASFTKSFPDDEENEKERLRQEEERAYNAYHTN